ncbi:hypothetical protein ACNKHW_23180 [Shigella flexneri]
MSGFDASASPVAAEAVHGSAGARLTAQHAEVMCQQFFQHNPRFSTRMLPAFQFGEL